MKTKSKPMTLYVPNSLRKTLEMLAGQYDLSLSAATVLLLERAVQTESERLAEDAIALKVEGAVRVGVNAALQRITGLLLRSTYETGVARRMTAISLEKAHGKPEAQRANEQARRETHEHLRRPFEELESLLEAAKNTGLLKPNGPVGA